MSKELFDRLKPGYVSLDPPSTTIAGFQISVTAGVLNMVRITFTNEPDSQFFAAFYLSKSFGAGTMSPKASAKRLLQATVIPSTPFQVDVAATYETKFGIPDAGSKIFVNVTLIDSTSGKSYKLERFSTIVLEV